MQGQQRPLRDQQLSQTEQAEQLRRVLDQALVAELLASERVLDEVERMLDVGPDARLQLFCLLE